MAPNSKNVRIIRAKLDERDQFSQENFKTVTTEIDNDLNEGDILLRNLYISLDPHTHLTFLPKSIFVAPVNSTIIGFGIGEVIESKNLAFPVKSVVLGFGIGWEQYSKVPSAATNNLTVISDAHNPKIALTHYANALGMPGLAAFSAMETIAKPKKGQVVYVSSAAGPVGAFLAIQAKREGAFVIGSAGSDDKVQYLLETIGVDVAFNYKVQDTRVVLDRYAKDGLDIYYDMVGGETLDTVMAQIKISGEIVILGNISVTNSKTPYLTKNLLLVISKGLSLRGLSVFHHSEKYPLLWKKFRPLIVSGEIPVQNETVVRGVENAPEVFVDYLNGKYYGKVLIEVATL